MRKPIVLAGALTVVAAAAGVGMDAYADRQLKQALDAWRAELPQGTELSYGRIEADGRDAAVLHAVRFTTDRTPQPVTVRAERLRIEDAAFQGDTLRSVAAFEFDTARAESRGSTMTLAGGEGDDVELTGDYRVRSVGRAELRDLEIEDARGSSSARRIRLRDLGGGQLRRLEVQALAIAQRDAGAGQGAPVRRVLIDRVDVRDADVDDLQRLSQQTDSPDAGQVVAALRGDGIRRMGLEGLEMIEQGQRIAALDALDLSLETPDDGAITFELSYKGGYADATHPEIGYPLLAALGYRELHGDGGLELAYHPEDGRFAVETLEMDLRDVAQLSLTGRVVGIPAVDALSRQLREDPQGLQDQAALAGLELVLENQGLAGRLAEMRAQQTGQEAADVRRQQAQSIRQMAQQMQLSALGEPVAEFVEQAGTLTLRAEPAQPVSFRRLQQLGMGEPAELRRTLNLQAARSD